MKLARFGVQVCYNESQEIGSLQSSVILQDDCPQTTKKLKQNNRPSGTAIPGGYFMPASQEVA